MVNYEPHYFIFFDNIVPFIAHSKVSTFISLTLRASDCSATLIGGRIGETPMQQSQQAIFTIKCFHSTKCTICFWIKPFYIAQSSLNWTDGARFNFSLGSLHFSEFTVGILVWMDCSGLSSWPSHFGGVCEYLVTFARDFWVLTGEQRAGLLVVQWVKNIARRCALPTRHRRQLVLGQLELWYRNKEEYPVVII